VSDTTRDFHPVANLFPLISGDDFAALSEDIRANGLLEPIWLHPDGRIVDGRNRYKACRAAGVEPTFRRWSGNGSLVEFVVSLNLHRRHLTSSQRAMAALDAEAELAKEAEERRRERISDSRSEPETAQRVAPSEKLERESRERAAKLLGTNRQYVSDAKKLTAERPDLAEQVKTGEISLPEAKRQSNPALYTSNSPEWYTPGDIVSRVVATLGSIDLDPCSNSHDNPTVPAAKHFTEADDGLTQEWAGRIYMNPPYGRGIDEWVAKLDAAYRAGRVPEAIALLPARVDTRWFRILRDYTVCFVNGRLRFSGADPAPFPSAAIYLGPDSTKFYEHFGPIGDLYRRIDAELAA
jgi:hypothetical protein